MSKLCVHRSMPPARWPVWSLLLSLLLVAPVRANDAIWSGLFHYQQQMAQLGNAEAQYKLAEHYEQGLGVEQDLEQAKSWYEKASRQGYEPASSKLKDLGSAKSAPAVDPAVAQLEREHQARLQAQQELARINAERVQMEQELARQREELQRLKAEKEQQKAAVAVQPAALAAPAKSPAAAAPLANQQRQREEAIAKAEDEYRRAMERRIARERLEMEMLRLQSTPIGYDN